jgi:Ca-activated chloride channel family protein
VNYLLRAHESAARTIGPRDLLEFSVLSLGNAPCTARGRRFVVKGLVFLFSALVLSGAVIAAQQQEPAAPGGQTPTFRSGANLVALNVTVVDGARYVTGLKPTDFLVYEDGVKQDVRFFESSGVPVDLIVLLDTSSSMTDKMDAVHDAAIGFLKTLREGDRGAVVAFNDTVNVLQPLTPDRGLLEKAILSTRARGATSLNNALYIALKQFGQAARSEADVRRQAIAVLTDGEDTASLVTFDDVLALARKTGVNIYTVGLQSRTIAGRTVADNSHRYFSEADYAMRTLARETGAQSFFPAQPADLKGAYSSIAAELASQYSIGYVPANARMDGRFRRVVVQVVARPELRPRTRMGYTADGVPTASIVGGSPSLQR